MLEKSQNAQERTVSSIFSKKLKRKLINQTTPYPTRTLAPSVRRDGRLSSQQSCAALLLSILPVRLHFLPDILHVPPETNLMMIQ